ncbi:duf786 family protein [Phlyctema vagabunda]|uniref:ER membrane protein complex subunit 6 n=1 Tax=Phlyctema vagabunda TaxID=108571 RepID=A0ABR4PN89_9HELO
MSRNSQGSQHRSHGSHHSRNTEGDFEEMIQQVKNMLIDLDDVVSNRASEVDAYIPSARSAMAAMDHIRFFRNPQRVAEQVWVIQGLQDFAYYDSDAGSIQDIAEWCQSSWLKVLRNHPENPQVLTGLGSNWLQRAQAALSKIQYDESSEFSNTSSSQRQRLQEPYYVEARGYLQPAVDFYSRAVRAADAEGTISGGLLASAAEAEMSLGNTLATLHNLTASLFGIGAGILGLESYPGFLFYIFFSLLTSALVYVFRVQPAFAKDAEQGGELGLKRFFGSGLELWSGGLVEGLSGFVLTWTLFYGLVRA